MYICSVIIRAGLIAMENIYISKLFVSTDCPRESKEFFIFYIMKEIWKDIEGFEVYEVSNFGNIRRQFKKGFKLRKPVHQLGYAHVTLSYKNKFKKYPIHRLVAKAFIPNTDNKPCVNHINGIKTDNRVENLEWCTYSENEKHSFDKLGKITNGIIRRKIPLNKISYIKELNKKGFSQRSIAKQFNVSQTTIWLIINEKTYVKHV